MWQSLVIRNPRLGTRSKLTSYACPLSHFLPVYRSAWAHANASSFVGYNAYGVESVLHELFLSSEHRTFE